MPVARGGAAHRPGAGHWGAGYLRCFLRAPGDRHTRRRSLFRAKGGRRMKNDYLKESRRFYALAQTMELLARALKVQPDRDVAVASAVLADMAVSQLNRMDKAIDRMIERARCVSRINNGTAHRGEAPEVRGARGCAEDGCHEKSDRFTGGQSARGDALRLVQQAHLRRHITSTTSTSATRACGGMPGRCSCRRSGAVHRGAQGRDGGTARTSYACARLLSDRAGDLSDTNRRRTDDDKRGDVSSRLLARNAQYQTIKSSR